MYAPVDRADPTRLSGAGHVASVTRPLFWLAPERLGNKPCTFREYPISERLIIDFVDHRFEVGFVTSADQSRTAFSLPRQSAPAPRRSTMNAATVASVRLAGTAGSALHVRY